MPKEKNPVEDIPAEENVITPEEFEAIEKKERKGKSPSGVFSKKPKPPEPPKKKGFFEREKETSQDRLILDIEKIQAKLETNEGLRQVMEEKISRISEEIGELRSAILEKERTFNKIEGGFEKVKEIFDDIQPKKIRAELDRKDEAIEKTNAKVESLETRLSETKKSVSEVISIMDKIKDLKNLAEISGVISKKMAKIEEDKKDTTKTAAKIESMFSELSEKMAEFHTYKDKIEFSSDSMHDLMKAIDMIEVRIENAFTKDDAKKLDDRFDQMEKDYTAKVQTIRDIVDDLVDSLRKGGVKDLLAKEGKSRIDEINKRLSQMSDSDKSIRNMKEEISKLREEKKKEMEAMVSQIERLKQASTPKKDEPAAARQEKAAKKQEALAGRPAFQEQPGLPDAEAAPAPGISMLIEQCHGHIDKGDIEQAKALYARILSFYERGKDDPASDSEQAYGKIKRLYYRLQIYQ